MNWIKNILLGAIAMVSTSVAHLQGKNTTESKYPYTYYSMKIGNTWMWMSKPPKGASYCEPYVGTSCTITTTVPGNSISKYNGTYLPGRLKSPAEPTNFTLSF